MDARHLDGAVPLELHAGHLAQESRVALLAEREDHGVRGQRLEPPRRLGESVLVQFHRLDRQLRAVERGDRAQPVDPHSLPFGLLRLLGMGRHLVAGTPVDDQCVVRAQAAGHPGSVHRGVAAAVDRDAPPDHRAVTGGDAAQERHRVHDPARVLRRDIDTLGQVGAHRDEGRVESALAPFGVQVLHPVAAGDAHAQRSEPVKLAIEDVTGHPVGRDAVTHHPAGPVTGIPYLDLVAEPGQVVGRGKPARAGPDDQYALTAADRRRVERPPPLQREIAEEPLDRVNRDGAVEAGAVADALARVIADPPVDRRHRIVRDQLPPRLLMTADLRVRQPRLDVLPRRAPGIARRQQVYVDRAPLAHRTGPRSAVQQIRQRREVASLGHIVSRAPCSMISTSAQGSLVRLWLCAGYC